MKDFKKKNLYESESGLFEAVISQRIETITEYNKVGKFRVGNETEDEDIKLIDSAINFDDFSGGGYGGIDEFSFDSGFGSITHNTTNPDSLPQGEWKSLSPAYFKVIMAPYWSIHYLYKGIVYDSPFRIIKKGDEGEGDSPDTPEGKEQDRVLISKFRVASLIVGLLSFVQLTGYINILISPFVGVLAILLSGYCDYYLERNYDEGIIVQLLKRLETDEDEDSEHEGISLADDSLDDYDMDFGGNKNKGEVFNPTGINDPFAGFDGFDDDDTYEDNYGSYKSALKYDDDDEDEVEEDDDPETQNNEVTRLFPFSPVSTTSDGDFNTTLLEVFKEGNQYKGSMPRTRTDMLRMFAPYLPSNDPGFAKWYEIKERSTEYDNIAFTLYKALVMINNKFDIANGSTEKLTIFSIKRTPLIYKIEVKLPSYFKDAAVMREAAVFESFIKTDDNDTKVGVLVSSFSGRFVIKFLRLDKVGLVSYGDILRYQGTDNVEAPIYDMVKDKGLPVLVGLKDNEYPLMIDLEDNTSGNIVGGSGSGKSWFTFQIMISLLTTNTPEELNFIVMDGKNAPYWGQFAKAPHVLGYHTDVFTYVGILNEVMDEFERRQRLLIENGIEDFKGLRKQFKAEGNYKGLAENPFLIIVIDEITATMATLKTEDEDAYKELRIKLTKLSSVIRSAGIRIITIGQRSIDNSIPKDLLANSSMKFGMKMDVKTDNEVMFGKGYDRGVRIPKNAGEGLLLDSGTSDITYIKTLVPGGKSDPQMMFLIRAVAMDWVRRTIGTDMDYTKPPVSMRGTMIKSFNRNQFYIDTLRDLQEGRIVRNKEINEGYQVNVVPGESADTVDKYGVSRQTVVFDNLPSNDIDNDEVDPDSAMAKDFLHYKQSKQQLIDEEEDDDEEAVLFEPNFTNTFNDEDDEDDEFDISVNDVFGGFNFDDDEEDLDETDLIEAQDLLIQQINKKDESTYTNDFGDDLEEFTDNSKKKVDERVDRYSMSSKELNKESDKNEDNTIELFNTDYKEFNDSQSNESNQYTDKKGLSKGDTYTDIPNELEDDTLFNDGINSYDYGITRHDSITNDGITNDGITNDDSSLGIGNITNSGLQNDYWDEEEDDLLLDDLLLEDEPVTVKDEPVTQPKIEQVQAKSIISTPVIKDTPKPTEQVTVKVKEPVSVEHPSQAEWLKLAAEKQQLEDELRKKDALLKQSQVASTGKVSQPRIPRVKGSHVIKANQEMPYSQTSVATSNLGIKQYIIKHGEKVDTFTRAVHVDLIKDHYTPREIDIALSNGLIYKMGEHYATGIN